MEEDPIARRCKSTIDDELIDKLLEGREHGAALLDGLIGELKKRLTERMLSAELDVHLEDEDQQATKVQLKIQFGERVTLED